MFQEGDLIVYGGHGVCRITAAGIREVCGVRKECDYYAITPLDNSGVIYAPVEGGRIPMRCLMTPDEAAALLREARDVEPLHFGTHKERGNACRDISKGVDCHEMVALLKALYHCRTASPNRKPSYADERVFRQTEKLLFGELSLVLSVSEDDARRMFIRAIETPAL